MNACGRRPEAVAVPDLSTIDGHGAESLGPSGGTRVREPAVHLSAGVVEIARHPIGAFKCGETCMRRSPSTASGANHLVAVALALGACLAVAAVETAVFAQVQPLGPNQIAIGAPYKIAWDQPDPANITYWRVYHQSGTAAKVKIGADIPFSTLLNGGVTVELPAVGSATKTTILVGAVNDPSPATVTAAETLSPPFAVEFLKPAAIPPGAPTNLRKVALRGTLEWDDERGRWVAHITATPVSE